MLDTARRYVDVLDASVPEEEPTAADEPAWVRRLDERMAVMPALPGDRRRGRRDRPG